MKAKGRWLVVPGAVTVLILVVVLMLGRDDRQPEPVVSPEPPAPEVVVEDIAPDETLPGTPAPPPPVEPEIPPAPPTPEPPETSRITGRILMYGRPLADAGALTIEMTRAGWKLAKPDYEFAVSADGFFRGEVLRNEYQFRVLRGAARLGTFTWQILEPEESRAFDLVELFRVTGRVLDREGHPLPKVNLDFSETRDGGGFHVVTTDESGRFETRLAAGTRQIVRLRSKSLGGITLGTVTVTEDTEVEFRLPPGSRVAGHISTESGEPLVDTTVKLRNREVKTDSSGNFEFTDVSPGRYHLGTWKDPYGLTMLVPKLDVTYGEDVWLDLTEKLPVSWFITGKVVSIDGEPLRGIRVNAAGVGGGYGGKLTKRDGSFRIRLYGEIGSVWANTREKRGLCHADAKVKHGDRDITLVLEQAVELKLLFLLDQQPVSGRIEGSLEVHDESGTREFLSFYEYAKNMRRFRRLPAGSYRLRFRFDRAFARTDWYEIEIRPGRENELTIDLVAGSRVVLDFETPFCGTFFVRDAAGQILRARELHTPVLSHKCGVVAAGTYEVLAFSRQGETIVGKVKVLADDCRTILWKVHRCSARIKVLSADGQPVAGRRIRIRGSDAGPQVPLGVKVGKLFTGTVLFEREAVTDEAGRCTFTGLIPATYVLDGHGGEKATITLQDGESSHAEVVLIAE